MTKQEFESRLGKEVSLDEYSKIELVYTFHPSIGETEGKDQMAMLVRTFGMRIIEDMLPTANKASEYENKIVALRHQLDSVVNEFNEFKKGNI